MDLTPRSLHFVSYIVLLQCILQAFQAVSGRDGSLIWNFGEQDAKNKIMNLYTAQILPDIDGDGVVDVLAIHGGDPLQDPGTVGEDSDTVLSVNEYKIRTIWHAPPRNTI